MSYTKYGFRIKRLLFCTVIFSFFYLQILPLKAVMPVKLPEIDLSQLDQPLAGLIEKKLNEIFSLSSTADDPETLDKLVEIIIDLYYELQTQYQVEISIPDAICILKQTFKEQGVEDVEKYFEPMEKKLRKAAERKQQEVKRLSSSDKPALQQRKPSFPYGNDPELRYEYDSESDTR